MYTYMARIPAALIALLFLVSGCNSASDKLQRTYFQDSKTLKYGPVMAFGFQNGVWSEVKGADNQPLAQFKGAITPGLHDFAMAKLMKTGDRSVFDAACGYVGNLVKAGKISGDPGITFKLADYPFDSQGKLSSEAKSALFESPDSQKFIRPINFFYMNRYWAANSECTIQWKLDKKGPVIVKASNQYWDDDPAMASPEKVTEMIYDYMITMTTGAK